jgi:hypothetical protein
MKSLLLMLLVTLQALDGEVCDGGNGRPFGLAAT